MDRRRRHLRLLHRPRPGVYRSDNGGDSWTKVFELPTLRIVADPHGLGIFYALVDKQLHRTTNGGASWQLLANFAGTLDRRLGRLGLPRPDGGGPQGRPRPLRRRRRQLRTGADRLPHRRIRAPAAAHRRPPAWRRSTRPTAMPAAGSTPASISAPPGAGPTPRPRHRPGSRRREGGRRLPGDLGGDPRRGLALDRRRGAFRPLAAGRRRGRGGRDPGRPLRPHPQNGLRGGPPAGWRPTAPSCGRPPTAASPGRAWRAATSRSRTGAFAATQFAGKKIYLTTLQGFFGGTNYLGVLSSEGGGPWKPLQLNTRLVAAGERSGRRPALRRRRPAAALGRRRPYLADRCRRSPALALATLGEELLLGRPRRSLPQHRPRRQLRDPCAAAGGGRAHGASRHQPAALPRRCQRRGLRQRRPRPHLDPARPRAAGGAGHQPRDRPARRHRALRRHLGLGPSPGEDRARRRRRCASPTTASPPPSPGRISWARPAAARPRRGPTTPAISGSSSRTTSR